MLLRLKNRLKFELERFVLRGAFHRLLLIVILIVLVSVGAGLVVHWTTPAFADTGEAIWWAFLRLTDPGYLGDDAGVLVRTVSTIVTLLGYVLFLGALIAIMTQALNANLQRLQMGLTPIAQNGHFLILGWTNRTLTIVKELLLSEAGLRSFLRAQGARRLNIVILAETLGPDLVQELRDELGPLYDPRRITLRSGSPLRPDHLQRVDYLNAAAILLPLPEADGGITPDGQVLKILLTIGSTAASRASPVMPRMVAELADASKRMMARHAFGHPLTLLPSDELLSRLIAQSVRHQGLTYVYDELFSHEWGNELYLRDAGELAGRPFGELLELFPRAIPLGLVRAEGEGERCLLKPDPDTPVEPGDRLLLMAADELQLLPGGQPRPAQPLTGSLSPVRRQRRVLLLGWNDRVPALLNALDQTGDVREVEVLSFVPLEERERLVARGPGLRRLSLSQRQGDYAAPGVLAALEPAGFDNVVILASDRMETDVDADTRAVLGYLMLQECLRGREDGPAVLVELLDPDNVALFRTRPDEVLISPRVLSHVLTQVTLRPELAVVLEELLRPGGVEIDFRPVADFGLEGETLRFKDIQRVAARHGAVALGVQLGGTARDPDAGPDLNPDHEARLGLQAGDELVVLVDAPRQGGGA